MKSKVIFRSLIGLILIIVFLPHVSAAHFIIGQLDDAHDGTGADGRLVVLWNYQNGILDNLTDTVGATGNSGQANAFMIDCELLSNGCFVGDVLTMKIFDSGDNYATEEFNVTVAAAGFSLVTNRLNSPPNITFASPADFANLTTNLDLSCFAEDLDSNLDNATLYGNWTGSWEGNSSVLISGGSDTASFPLFSVSEGTYSWGCYVTDNVSIRNWTETNYTFNVDLTPPVVTSVLINETPTCGELPTVRVNCTTTDSFTGIDEVIIEAVSANYTENYTASLLLGDIYYSDVNVNESGDWTFTCYSLDYSGNSDTSQVVFSAPYDDADLEVSDFGINLSVIEPYEGENVTISSLITNNGCADANNFLFGFYLGDPDFGGSQIGDNQTVSVLQDASLHVNITWLAEIGTPNIFVLADVGEAILEVNESNNKANNTFLVPAWQEIYGNFNLNKILGNLAADELNYWINETGDIENIFITDVESNVDWDSLVAISRNTIGQFVGNDFEDIDAILGMSGYNDSVSNIMTTNGSTPISTDTFVINTNTVLNVPIINSTNNSNFITGVLWDSSDDSNGQFDFSESEDIVFAGKINYNSPGQYGTYDYEMRFPARLREQDGTDTADVYFYYALP